MRIGCLAAATATIIVVLSHSHNLFRPKVSLHIRRSEKINICLMLHKTNPREPYTMTDHMPSSMHSRQQWIGLAILCETNSTKHTISKHNFLPTCELFSLRALLPHLSRYSFYDFCPKLSCAQNKCVSGRNEKTRTSENLTIIYISVIVRGVRRQQHIVYYQRKCSALSV